MFQQTRQRKMQEKTRLNNYWVPVKTFCAFSYSKTDLRTFWLFIFTDMLFPHFIILTFIKYSPDLARNIGISSWFDPFQFAFVSSCSCCCVSFSTPFWALFWSLRPITLQLHYIYNYITIILQLHYNYNYLIVAPTQLHCQQTASKLFSNCCGC